MADSPDYDAVVIGSGAGGLAAAVALANAGQKVLVLEQHYMAGGWCHSFVLEGHRFSPGVHYIGELEEGGFFREIFEGLGVANDLEFCKLNEDGFDHYLVAGERFDVPVGRERFVAKLKTRFPEHKAGIDKFFNLMASVASDLQTFGDYSEGWRAALLPFKAPHLVFRGMRKLGPYLDKWLPDPMLQAFVTGLCGDYGLPPRETAVALHAGVMGHYFDGGYYPRGGAYRIPRAFVRQLKRKGGEIRLSTAVAKILLEGGRAVGVETADGERITAKNVISNADPHMTFERLIGLDNLPARLRKKVRRTKYSLGSLALFLATDLDLKSMGYDSGNYWFYETTDVGKAYNGKFDPATDEFAAGFVTITTLKDPSKGKKGEHTLEVFSFGPHDLFSKWEGGVSGERGPEYQALKDRMTEKLLRIADKVIPDLSKNLTFCETGTPLSNTYYCAAHKGNIYGTSKIRSQLGPGSYPLKSAIPGLYMCGASTLSHGVLGVAVSGLGVAGKILGCSLKGTLTQKSQLTTYRSEHPEEWVDSLGDKRDKRSRIHAEPTVGA